MVVELDPGTQDRGRAARRASTIPVNQTLPERQRRRDPRGARRRHARLPAAAARRRRRGPAAATPRTCRRRSGASSPTGRDLAQDHAAARGAPRQHPPLDPQLQRCSAEALGDKDDELAQLVDSSNAVFRRFADQDANLRDDAAAAAAARCSRRTRRWPRPTALGHDARPDAQALRPGARALGPSLRADAAVPAQDDADHPRPAAAVRARRAADGQALRPAARDLADADAGPHDARSRSSTTLLNELAYNPPGTRGGLPVLDRLGQPRRRLDLRHAGRARPDPPRHRS